MPSAESSSGGGGGNIAERMLRLLQTDYSHKPKPDISAYLRPTPVTAVAGRQLNKPMMQQPSSGMSGSFVNGIGKISSERNWENPLDSGDLKQGNLELKNKLKTSQDHYQHVQRIKSQMASMGRIACNLIRERTNSNNVAETAKYQQINASSSVTSLPKMRSSSVTENKPPSHLQFLLKPEALDTINNPMRPPVGNSSQCNTPQMNSGNKLTPLEFLMKPVEDTKQQNNANPRVENAIKSTYTESSARNNKSTEFLMKPIEDTQHQSMNNVSSQVKMTYAQSSVTAAFNASQMNFTLQDKLAGKGKKDQTPSSKSISTDSSVRSNKPTPFEFLMKPIEETTTKISTTNNFRLSEVNNNNSQANVPSSTPEHKPLPFEFLLKSMEKTDHQTNNNSRSSSSSVTNTSQLNTPKIQSSAAKCKPPSQLQFLLKPVEDTMSQTNNKPTSVGNSSQCNTPEMNSGNKLTPFEFLMKPIEDTKHQSNAKPTEKASKSISTESPLSGKKPTPFEFLMKPIGETPKNFKLRPEGNIKPQSTKISRPQVVENAPKLNSPLTEDQSSFPGNKLQFLMKPIEDTKQQSNGNQTPVESTSKSTNTESSDNGKKPTPFEFLLKPIENAQHQSANISNPTKKFIPNSGGDTKHQSNNKHHYQTPSVGNNGSQSNHQSVQSPTVTHDQNEMKFIQNFMEKIQKATPAKSQNDELLPMDDRCTNLLRNLHPNGNFSSPLSTQQGKEVVPGSDVALVSKDATNRQISQIVGDSNQRETMKLGMHGYELIPDTENQLKLRQYMKELGICDDNQQEDSRGNSPKPEFVSVYWDLENCSMISGKNAGDAVKIIRDTLYKGLCEGEFMVYCDVRKEDAQVIKSLHEEGVGVVHVESSMQTVPLNMKIGKRMMNFCSTQPGSLVILVTGDSNYKSVIMQLKNRFKAKICLVHPSDTKRDLIDHATESWRFEALLASCPNKLYSPRVKKEEVFACLVINIPQSRTEYNRIKQTLMRLFSKYNGKIWAYEPPTAIMTFMEEELFKRATKRVHMEKFPVPLTVNNTVTYPTLQVYALLPGWDSVPASSCELTKMLNFIKDPTVELLAYKKRLQSCGNN